jgi:signal transduction histidine kinase
VCVRGRRRTVVHTIGPTYRGPVSAREGTPTSATPPRPEHGGWLGRVEHLVAVAGARLLAQQRLRLVVWLIMLAALAVNAATMPSLYDAVVPIALVVAVLQAASLVWALSRPGFAVVVSTVAVGATTVLTADGGPLPWPIPVVTLVTLALTALVLAVTQPWPAPVATAGLGVVAAALGGLPFLGEDAGPYVVNLLTAASVLALVVTFGVLVHEWSRSRAELLEQQEIAATAQQRRHVMEERNRIARELHDVVAHGLSVISIQASTMRYRVKDVPPEVVAELDDITESARGALVEMRGLLAVLRQEDGERELAPQPTLTQVPALVESTRRGTETVRLQVTGALDDPRVPEVTALSVYRIVQEALSNAVRHAPGSAVDVRLAITASQVVLDVENGAPAVLPTATAAGAGYGLRGMRERAGSAGGTLRAGPTPSGGYRVHATLPSAHDDGSAIAPEGAAPASSAAGREVG